MRLYKNTRKQGLTLTEMVVAMTIATIVMLGLVGVLADNQKGWQMMYNRAYSDVVTDAYATRKAFDKIVRSASSGRHEVDDAGQFVELYYYDSDASAKPDRYVRLYTADRELLANFGQIDPDTYETLSSLRTQTLARNVDSVAFSMFGRNVKLVMNLNNDSETLTMTCSASRYNE